MTTVYRNNGRKLALIKLGFMGLTPDQLKHIGLRAAGGAAAGAGAGALSAGEGNRMSGALAGGALGGLTAGGLSLAHKKGLKTIADTGIDASADPGLVQQLLSPGNASAKRNYEMLQRAHNAPFAATKGIQTANIPRTMLGGGAAGALPGMVAGRAQRED